MVIIDIELAGFSGECLELSDGESVKLTRTDSQMEEKWGDNFHRGRI